MGAPEMHKPTIVTDGGPWAEHDMACAVCHERKAVIDVASGAFQPCGRCQRNGWRLVHVRSSRLARIGRALSTGGLSVVFAKSRPGYEPGAAP